MNMIHTIHKMLIHLKAHVSRVKTAKLWHNCAVFELLTKAVTIRCSRYNIYHDTHYVKL